jgi:hypothetical protein
MQYATGTGTSGAAHFFRAAICARRDEGFLFQIGVHRRRIIFFLLPRPASSQQLYFGETIDESVSTPLG